MEGTATRRANAALTQRFVVFGPRCFVLLMAFMVVASLMVNAAPVAASTGRQAHGDAVCHSGGRIEVIGPRVATVSENTPIAQPLTQRVYYRAHLYRWDGSTWAYTTSTTWQQRQVTSISPVALPTASFTGITAGYWAASTEIHWYSAMAEAHLGSAPNMWVDTHRSVSPLGAIGSLSPYCFFQ